jgi:phosphate-selective porin OprO and OprP
VVAVGVCLVACASAATAQAVDQDEGPRSGLRWRNRPSIQIGEHIRLDLRLKLAYDWRHFDPDIGEPLREFRTRRAGVNGEIGSHVEFQIERDLNPDGRWRDVFVNWRTFRQAEVTVGRFKVPFGREQLIGITDVDFAFRTLASSTIPPARDKGVKLHGRFLRRGFTYEVGVFNTDGDNGRLEESQFVRANSQPEGIGHSFATRVTATPFRPLAKTFETLRVGGAYGTVNLPEGLNSLRGTSAWGRQDYFEPVYVKGRRQRYGTEVSYTPGPIGLVTEWMQVREERRDQGLRDNDLSDVVTTGWYASGTWLITGEKKENFNNPRHPLFTEGIGAIEIGARYEQLSFESAEKIGQAFTNPRAEHILGNTDSIWTLGVNWFPNRWVRLVANGIHETIDDPDRGPIRGIANYWSGVFRMQLVF